MTPEELEARLAQIQMTLVAAERAYMGQTNPERREKILRETLNTVHQLSRAG